MLLSLFTLSGILESGKVFGALHCVMRDTARGKMHARHQIAISIPQCLFQPSAVFYAFRIAITPPWAPNM